MNRKPIDTAPRDGSRIVVFGGYFDTNDQCYGMRNTEESGFPVIATNSGRFAIDDDCGGFIVNPTHWA